MKVGAVIVIAAILGFLGNMMFRQEVPKQELAVFEVKAGEKPLVNPMKGWAPFSDNSNTDYPASMAFVLIRWSELEPEEGVFRFEELETEKNLGFWREQGARFIIRLVCDYPGKENHMDIPEWLFEKTGGDGQWYDNDYGKGYAPNYGNPVFREEHGRMLQAVGDYYRDDGQVAVVQLGSLGHWGEWHVNHGAGLKEFPPEAITNKYVEQYREAFPGKLLMLRRPYAAGEQYQMGLFNDSFGVRSSHEEWLSWVEDGYVSEQTGETLAGMPEFWRYGPSGGGFSSNMEMEDYFGDYYSRVYELMRRSHTSFLGPHCPREKLSLRAGNHVNQMARDMGYCFALKSGAIGYSGQSQRLKLTVYGENSGVAPFYLDWPVEIMLRGQDGTEVYRNTCYPGVSSWMPGDWSMEVTLEGTDSLPAGTYQVTFAILDPLTGKPGISLANQGGEDRRYVLGSFELK